MNVAESKAKLESYATIKVEIKRLEKQAEELQPELLDILEQLNPTEEDHKVKTEFGSFSAVPKRKYSYSVDTQVLVDKVKDEKKREEQDGTATYEINPYLKFDAPKGGSSEE